MWTKLDRIIRSDVLLWVETAIIFGVTIIWPSSLLAAATGIMMFTSGLAYGAKRARKRS